jgi:deoxyribodipyrimidine photolyase
LVNLTQFFKAPNGKKWLVPYRKNEKVNFDEFETLTREEQKDQLNKFVKKFIPIIEEVENKFLEHKDELLQMKEV